MPVHARGVFLLYDKRALNLHERHDCEPVTVVIGVPHAAVSMNPIEFLACVAVVERGTVAALAADVVKPRTS